MSRLGWWWQTVWRATLAAFGRPTATMTARNKAAGPPVKMPPFPPWFQAPDDELGVSAATRAVLASTDDFGVALLDCVGYSTGFEFTISLRFRRPLDHSIFRLGGPFDDSAGLQVTIEYPDGNHAEGGQRPVAELAEFDAAAQEGKAPVPPSHPVVAPRGGGGDDKRYDMRFWSWPLPAAGPMKLAVRWRAAGLEQVSGDLDGSAIHAAGQASAKVWSW